MPQAPQTASWWRFPLALMLLEVVAYLSQDMYLPALPGVQRDFGVSQASAQLSIALWSAGAAVVQLVTGPVSDRLGRRSVLLAGVAGFALASLGCALSARYGWFLAARLAQGCAGVWAISVGYASLHELYEARTAIRIQAWMSSITVLAPALGPALGAGVMLLAPWQASFVLLAAGGAMLVPLLARWMPETVDRSLSSPLSVRAVSANYLSLLRNGPMSNLLGVWCLVFAVIVMWVVSGPFMLRDASGGSRPFVWAQLYACGAYIVGTRLVDPLLDLYPRGLLLARALDLCLAGIGATLAAALLRLPPALVVACYGVFMVGAGVLLPPLFRAIVERARQDMGLRMAWASSAINFAGALAGGVAAWLEVAHLRSFGLLGLLAVAAARALARGRRGLAPA
ncbi:MAG: MFS transporter [Betaproteobacteria bacterium]|nr:MFS transporter [Betaproteobacteria bacterium]MBU6511454.1 MFS transporter [Betaproteobacteria bacterium]MDE1954885.1 MFS transporter [Betaproteobacteria bacterium]MDE2151166.1 MFS transporter [Betaproteobacteria bacterium]MDE2479419.1 MFS transporter [Betaproteobacteria bacterium]